MNTNNFQSMCDGFNKVFFCLSNTRFVIVEAEYREGTNWYVPDFLTKIKWSDYGYNQSNIYAKYPQNASSRLDGFGKFYENVDSDVKEIVLMKIMSSYNGEPQLPTME